MTQAAWLTVGSRIAPRAIKEKYGPARDASRASHSAIEQARPLTRTAPT